MLGLAGRIPARGLIMALLYTGMGLPPVVVGLLVFVLLSRSGPFGYLEWLFSPKAMILAQTIIALPLIIGLTMAAVGSVHPALSQQLRALGATRWQSATTIVAETKHGMLAAVAATYGRIVAEVGAVLLVGGNIARLKKVGVILGPSTTGVATTGRGALTERARRAPPQKKNAIKPTKNIVPTNVSGVINRRIRKRSVRATDTLSIVSSPADSDSPRGATIGRELASLVPRNSLCHLRFFVPRIACCKRRNALSGSRPKSLHDGAFRSISTIWSD